MSGSGDCWGSDGRATGWLRWLLGVGRITQSIAAMAVLSAVPCCPCAEQRGKWPHRCTGSGGEHPPHFTAHFTAMGVTECEELPALAWVGCRGAEAAPVSGGTTGRPEICSERGGGGGFERQDGGGGLEPQDGGGGGFRKWAPKSKSQFCLFLPPADGWNFFSKKMFHPTCVRSK